jgi:hypothetical protein
LAAGTAALTIDFMRSRNGRRIAATPRTAGPP